MIKAFSQCLLLLLGLAAGVSGQWTDVVLTADQAVDGNGTPIANPVIVVRGNLINQVRSGGMVPSGGEVYDLSGYTIYVGTSANTYNYREVWLDNPGLTTYVVDNLEPGTYYFAATAFNSAAMSFVSWPTTTWRPSITRQSIR